jgi:endoglucanase
VNTYVDPSFFGTGTYNDGNAKDERFWAAAELFKTTPYDKYLSYISENPLPKAGFGWADMGSYGLVSYLTNYYVDTDEEMYKTIKDRFINDANAIVSTWKADGYKVALDNYVWGSNKDLSDRTMILIIANQIAPNPDYHAAIMDQLDYLLGRNAMDISYITGFGEKAAKNPHHRQSVAKKQAVPGMLVGGPNGSIMSVQGDPVAQMVDEETPPAKCYADFDGSYATNEICIYWNSPFVYILGYLFKD